MRGRSGETGTQDSPHLPIAPSPHHPIPPSASHDTPARAALSTVQSHKDAEYYRTVARLGIQAAEALEHAHQVGVIHRDIKPGNLLIEQSAVSDQQSAMRLWVTDFGLAQIQSDPQLTMTGDLLGTLRYMSPEQALAKRILVDHRSDIYSLGVTLYELLTLEPAFPGKDRQEVLRQVAFEEPKAPRKINAAVPHELETIVLKAMEKNPDGRFATARELAEDLRRWLENRPIRARQPTVMHKARKWTHRHRGIVATVIVAGVTLLLLTVVGLAISNSLLEQKNEEISRHELVARLNYELAEKQRRRARDAVDQYYTLVSESHLFEHPAFKPLRKQLLENALAYYESLAEEEENDSLAQAELAAAYLRVASIRIVTAQDMSWLDPFEKGIEIAGALPRDKKSLSRYAGLSAGVFRMTAGQARAQPSKPTDIERGLRAWEEARAIWQDFVRVHPTVGFRTDLAWFCATIGSYSQPGLPHRDDAKALKLLQQAEQLLESVIEESPQISQHRFHLAFVKHMKAFQLLQTKQREAAERTCREGLAMGEALVDDFPHIPLYRDVLAGWQFNFATALTLMGRSGEAKDFFKKAVSTLEVLVKEYPGIEEYSSHLKRIGGR